VALPNTEIYMTRKPQPITPESLKLLAYSVKDFCKAVGISPRMFYSLHQRSAGPKITRIGRRTLITVSAAEEWLASNENRKAA